MISDNAPTPARPNTTFGRAGAFPELMEDPVSLPVSIPEPTVIYDRQGADDFVALGHALAAHRATQGPVTFVYAPITVTHHHAAPALHPAGPAHPGIDVDTTGHSGTYYPPTCVEPLPSVPEHRTLAPLAFMLSGWATLAAALFTAVTNGDPAAIGATLAALAATGCSFAAITRERQ